ncbi:GtrA family protein [Sphingomonas sp.]|uniref:GtrA family protein n=1 Tax=Sphingomonas sp. TaxID=28214 RepID=UPI00286A9F3F|nr:GtrA family protein [Sphingomonas sp.]
MINRLTRRLSDEQRTVALQLARFAITGGLVTALSLIVYAAIAVWHRGPPQLANLLAYVVAAATGYIMHSRWSFRGHGRRDNTARTTTRFAAVSLISYALNSFWVWLFTHPLGLAPQWPMLPMLFVTPGVTFLLNRKWVFA